jgi:hypothetical protein
VPTSKLTRKAQRKQAYEAAMRDANNKSSDDEEEPDSTTIQVVAGWTMGNIEDLLQRISDADIKNCHRLPGTVTGPNSLQPAFFANRRQQQDPRRHSLAASPPTAPCSTLAAWAGA